MSRWLTTAHLAVAHLVLSGLVLVWDFYVARRITRTRGISPVAGALSAVAALLLAPALFIAIASTSTLSGRALYTIAWVWPVTAMLAALQSLYATVGRMTWISVGVPIVIYNVLLSLIYLARYLVFRGINPPELLLSLSAAQAGAQALAAHPLAILLPYYLHIPILSPATPARRRFGTPARFGLIALSAGWSALIVLAFPAASRAIQSYARYTDERLQERPQGDFLVGLKVFPTLEGGPPPLALKFDLELADTLSAGALSVYIAPSGATVTALDSLARSLERQRSAGRKIIAALAYSSDAGERYRASPTRYAEARLADVERIARRLRPDYLVPALDPYGAGRRALGTLPLASWTSYMTGAAAVVRRVGPRIKVMVHVGGFTGEDRVLFHWAAHADSPADALALSLTPWYDGAETLDERMLAADRWMAASRSAKEHWILEAGGFPMTHGDRSQERALWGALAWATSRSAIKGFIVLQASDYESPVGLRAPGGRIRSAAPALKRAIAALRERTAE